MEDAVIKQNLITDFRWQICVTIIIINLYQGQADYSVKLNYDLDLPLQFVQHNQQCRHLINWMYMLT